MEVLTAFVRERAPWPIPPGTPTPVPDADGSYHPPADVQTVLTVIGRERWAEQWPRDEPLPLPCLDLSGANLRGARFEGTTVIPLCLTGATLVGADLTGADLTGGVNLSYAYLSYADLTSAELGCLGVDDGMHLCADLMGALLGDANLTGADLSTATGLTQPQIDAAFFVDEPPKLPPDLFPPGTGRPALPRASPVS